MKRSHGLTLVTLVGGALLLGACTASPAGTLDDLSGSDLISSADLASSPADLRTADMSTGDLADAPPCLFGQTRTAGACVCAVNTDLVCGAGHCCAMSQTCLPALGQDLYRCSGPSGRLRAAFAYDQNRKTSLVFGGIAEGGQPPLATNAELTPVTWSALRGAAPNPVARFGSSLVYDEMNKRLLLFGGQTNDTTYLGDLWAWSGTAWSAVTTTGTPPAPRALSALAYDSARNVVVLYGGDGKPVANMGSFVQDDTWELNVGSNAWVQRSAGNAGPKPLEGHAMAYDAKNRRTVLFGGHLAAVGPFSYSNETWAWDGTSWKAVASPTIPNPRAYFGMAYDSARSVIAISGGETNAGLFQALGDIWELEGTTWTAKKPVTLVPGRSNHSMTYDAGRKLVLTFGGLQNDIQGASDQLWGWDGVNWKKLY